MALPENPGVYIMKNSSGKIIYIGKAKVLKNRVSQYFGSQNRHTLKVLKMVENVYDFDYIMTDSEFEALVLECSLIKQHQPKYNILLKDDKGYHYIKIEGKEYPRISVAKQKIDDGARYIGPYTSSFSVTNAVDEALKIFRLPQCSKVFPRDIGKGRPCLNSHIGLCSAVCSGKMSREEYLESVNSAIAFLQGSSADAVRDMKKQMNECAENLDFEKAARLRDRIYAIEKLNEKQKVFAKSVEEQDVFSLVQGKTLSCFMVLRFKDGRLYDSEHFFVDETDEPSAMRNELLKRYYSMRDFVPKRIMLDAEAEDMTLLEEWLSQKSGRSVKLVVPQRGEQAKLLEMCRSNAIDKLTQKMGKSTKQENALAELAKVLGLPHAPEFIESYDISHTGGSDNVAGMVVFKDGLPFKPYYKKFAIKGFTGQDDYASMAEVVERRFTHYLDENETDEGFKQLPDLILLDGGQGQVSAVARVLEKMGIDVPLFGMVKDSKHRTRAIAKNSGEISINSKREVFSLVTSIQDEVHRFAIGYHHKKHSKTAMKSGLVDIEGVGAKRANDLLKHFKTLANIKKASVEELMQVKGMPKNVAENIYNYFIDE
ncbi:MAG: excinuclease ABC subunit UvrC [Clostridiales bacterium]|nr:excinuclease ABC subunit UvrC [Clostridiales bacterium]